MAEIIKQGSVILVTCIITSYAGRKNDSKLIGLAGLSYLGISILTLIVNISSSVQESYLGMIGKTIAQLIKFIFTSGV